jgi:hypothetical protein
MISKKIKVSSILGMLEYLILGRQFELVCLSPDLAKVLPRPISEIPETELVSILAEALSFMADLRPDVPSPIRHWSLSAQEGIENSQHWKSQAEMMFEAHGVQAEKHTYLAIRHLDQARDHIHPIFCRIGLDGSLIRDTWRDCGISQQVCRDIETQYGMPLLASSVEPAKPATPKSKKKPRAARPESEMATRGVPPKKQQAIQCLESAWPKDDEVITYARFVVRLEEAGIDVLLNKRGASVGVSYRIGDQVWKSSTLGERYQWRGIEPHILRRVDGNDAEAAMRTVPVSETKPVLPAKPNHVHEIKPLKAPNSPLRGVVAPSIDVLALVGAAYDHQTIYQREAARNRKEGARPLISSRDRGVPIPNRGFGHRGWPGRPR